MLSKWTTAQTCASSLDCADMDVVLAAASLAAAALLPSPFHEDNRIAAGAPSSSPTLHKAPSPGGIDVVDSSTSPSADGAVVGVEDCTEKAAGHHYVRRRRMQIGARAAVRVSLLLSLALLSLSVLEAAPRSWLVFLCNDGRPDGDGLGAPYAPDGGGWFVGSVLATEGGRRRLRLTVAYRVLLWADCALVSAVAPAAVGGTLASRLFPPSVSSQSSSQSSAAGVSIAAVGFRRGTVGMAASALWGVTMKAIVVLRFFVGFIAAAAKFAVSHALGFRIRRTETLPRTMSNVSSSLDLERMVQTPSSPSPSASPPHRVKPSFWRTFPHGDETTTGTPARLRSFIPSRAFLIGAVLGATTSFIFLRAVGPFVAAGSTAASLAEGPRQQHRHLHLLLRDLVSRICALGVFLSQLLNGFGSVSLPYSCLSGRYLEPIDARTLADATESYKFLRKDADDKRRALADLRARRSNDLPVMLVENDLPSLPFDVRRRCLSSGTSGGRTQRLGDAAEESLRREVEFMDALSEELADDIEHMKDLRRDAAAARTRLGRVRGWVGAVFSVVLLVRVALSVFGLLRASNGVERGDRATEMMNVTPDISPRRKDPITMILLWMVGRDLLDREGGDFDAAAQGASLVLTAFLSVTQVRTFLRVAGALSRRVRGWLFFDCSRRRGDASVAASLSNPTKDAGTYLAASVLGCYFLACVVLMKRNLPAEHRSAFSTALGGGGSVNGPDDLIAFDIRVTNGTFAASALVSVFALGSLLGIRRQNSAAHNLYKHGIPESMKADV